MIEWLLSDRAEDRRALFEEAAGIGLYRDRRQTTERRLEETAGDLQRVEDLIAEVQSQLRSLARQKGKAERHVRLMEEKFAVQLTLAKRLLTDLSAHRETSQRRHAELERDLPTSREGLSHLEARRDEAARSRARADSQRTEIARGLGDVRLELGKLDGDLALAAERLANAAARKLARIRRARPDGRSPSAGDPGSGSRSSRAPWRLSRSASASSPNSPPGPKPSSRSALPWANSVKRSVSWRKTSRSASRRSAPSKGSATRWSPTSPHCANRQLRPTPGVRRLRRNRKSPNGGGQRRWMWPTVTAMRPSASPVKPNAPVTWWRNSAVAKRWSGPTDGPLKRALLNLTARRQGPGRTRARPGWPRPRRRSPALSSRTIRRLDSRPAL